MKDISQIDEKFAVKTQIEREGLRFYNAEDEPFRIYGVFKENGMFRRMPQDAAKQVNDRLDVLHTNCAGGRVRFITDSPYVAIQTKGSYNKMPHFAFTGSCGFDIYATTNGQTRYAGTFVPPLDVEEGYESVVDFAKSGEKLLTLEMPLYSEVSELYIGLKDGCVLKEAPDYTIEQPVVFYGSSITQGGCASKPGSSYQSIISRNFDCNYINLGFSSGARGEDRMMEYVNGLDMSVFVYDYDHNAPTLEHLKATHQRMFEGIRQAKPDLPIILMTRPKYYLDQEEEKRFEVIYNTYLAAQEKNDENVYFIGNKELTELVKDNGTVDGCHPTDSGFFNMAVAVSRVLKEIFADYFAKRRISNEKGFSYKRHQ